MRENDIIRKNEAISPFSQTNKTDLEDFSQIIQKDLAQ